MIWKVTNVSGEWGISDNKRNTYNVVNKYLFPNLSNADQTQDSLDFLSNGFKIRRTGDFINTNNYNYIYMAFAEFPLVGSNGLAGTAR